MSTPSLNIQAITTYRAARFNPLADFGPDKLTTAIREFRAGRLRDLSMIMDSIEETDDVLMSVVPKAKAAVARRGWEILTVDTKNPADAALAEQQKETLTYFYNNLRATSAWDQDELGGVSLLLRQMMDAKGKRYSVHNIVWRPDGQGHYTATFWHTPLCFFENTTGRMRYIAQPYGYEGDDMEPGSWLVTKGTGVMIACSVAWMFKHLPLQDWLIYCERHGMPGIEGVTDAQRGSPQWIAMVDAVTQAARDFSWVRNRSDEIKTIDFGGTGTLPYPQLIERMDRALSALWRGADLSTISAGSGSGQGASLQAMEAELIEQDDATWLSETLSMKVDRLVLDNVYGPAPRPLAPADVPAGGAQLVWANMCLHAVADPQALMARWHTALQTEGFLMFSTLGPGSLAPLRALYARQGWPPPFAPFVDMHDLGDMLVHAGFADPVMDQETITLTWADGPALLRELRTLGGNMDPSRHAGLRTPRWRQQLQTRLQAECAQDGRVALPFEIVYGHAFKPVPRPRVAASTAIAVEDLRTMARTPRRPS